MHGKPTPAIIPLIQGVGLSSLTAQKGVAMATELHLNDRIYRVVNASLPFVRCGTFRPLTDAEETAFRTWARSQPLGTKILPIWHPAIQDELLISGLGKEQ